MDQQNPHITILSGISNKGSTITFHCLEDFSEHYYKTESQQIGNTFILELETYKEDLNEGGPLSNKIGFNSEELSFIRSLLDQGVSFDIDHNQEERETSDWTRKPKYLTTRFLSKLIELLTEIPDSPESIENNLFKFMQEEDISQEDIIDYQSIYDRLQKHFQDVFQIAKSYKIPTHSDRIFQRLDLLLQKRKEEAFVKFHEIRESIQIRLVEIAILVLDKL